ncbi:3'(2'),5'-bisphosphate nucleotidase CysQ family protein [Coraliomargarita parva]|uniref:3'(2'),5'-bisphosphate nucleotidase CysQ family protein n=1 Tax=Coraliomargarita parva TaxID=3014050 RepID=UPI0022B490AB|nr:inositol monophosphatase family protein [Coraliomargarita parva]
MQLSPVELSALADLACEAAHSAGALILESAAGGFTVQRKDGGDSLASQLVTEVDERSQERILQVLAPSFEAHDLALLTEERTDDGSRFEKDYYWCIDPLDGTLPFTRGIPGYAVAIALVSQNGRAEVGVVYDPVHGRLYRAVRGQGLAVDGLPWSRDSYSNSGELLKVYCDCGFADSADRESRSRAMEAMARRFGYRGVELRIGGGAVSNVCRVLEDGPAVYYKLPKSVSGGGSIWDYAATSCIYAEAGAYATDFNGKPLPLNQAGTTFMNRCGVCFTTEDKLSAALPF